MQSRNSTLSATTSSMSSIQSVIALHARGCVSPSAFFPFNLSSFFYYHAHMNDTSSSVSLSDGRR